MLENPDEFYFMLLEENEEDIKTKVKFCSFVKVLEFWKPKRVLNEAAEKIKNLKEIAKKLECIDGGLKKSKNFYRARIDLDGVLTDLKTGKKLALPLDKMRKITRVFTKKKIGRFTDTPVVTFTHYNKGNTSTPNLQPLKLPTINRILCKKFPKVIKNDKTFLFKRFK